MTVFDPATADSKDLREAALQTFAVSPEGDVYELAKDKGDKFWEITIPK